MTTKGKAGRKAIDGVTCVTARINAVLTPEHKRRLEALATKGISPWIREAIDKAWAKHQKATS